MAVVAIQWGITLWALLNKSWFGGILVCGGAAIVMASFLWELRASPLVSPAILQLAVLGGFCAISIHLALAPKTASLVFLGSALLTGAVFGSVGTPSTEGIPRAVVDEMADGTITTHCYLFVGGADAHSIRNLYLPGAQGMPWSVGHALLGAVGGGVGLLSPGATFLPVRKADKPYPLWTYLGGGGEEVPPITTLGTSPLMGAISL